MIIKKILSDYIKNELIFHDKVIKLYLNAFKYIKNDFKIETKTHSSMSRIANRRSLSESSLSELNSNRFKKKQSRNFKFISKDSNYSSSSNSSIVMNAINNNSQSCRYADIESERQASSEEDLFNESNKVTLKVVAPNVINSQDLKKNSQMTPSLKVYNETEL